MGELCAGVFSPAQGGHDMGPGGAPQPFVSFILEFMGLAGESGSWSAGKA